MGPSLRSTITVRPDFPERMGALGLAMPRWVLRARAIPSTDQMSGWLLSLTSMLTLSFCSSRVSTSPLTYASIWLSPSSARGTFCPRRSSRSVRENWTEGVLAYLLLSYPFEVGCEELSDVLDLLVHHVEPVDSEPPCDYRYFDAEGFCDFWSEYSAAAELHPSVSFLVGLQLNTWLGEGEVVWLEPDLVGPSDLAREHLQDPEEVA